MFLWYIKRDVVLKEKSFHVLIVYAYDTLAAGVVNGGLACGEKGHMGGSCHLCNFLVLLVLGWLVLVVVSQIVRGCRADGGRWESWAAGAVPSALASPV